MPQDVAHPVVAVHDHGTRLFRQICRKPFDECIHRIDLFCFAGDVLFGPAVDLTTVVVTGSAKGFQTTGNGINLVQLSHNSSKIEKHGSPVCRAAVRKLVFGIQTALYHFHDVELRTNYLCVFAQAVHFWHRHARIGQSVHNPVFPINLVRTGQ